MRVEQSTQSVGTPKYSKNDDKFIGLKKIFDMDQEKDQYLGIEGKLSLHVRNRFMEIAAGRVLTGKEAAK
ncbi:hypothetical protein JCM15765_10950 [Paradesulfitobacterium aromaticivorans]